MWLKCTFLFFFFFQVQFVSLSILEEVKNVINNANDFVEDVASGLKYVKAGVDFLDNVITSVGDDQCIFHCSRGEKAIPDSKYKPVPSGCGAYGVTISVDYCPKKEFADCCDHHDICYGTCNAAKEYCDKKFQDCLYKACERKKKELKENYTYCKMTTKLFFTGTAALGCKAYKDAQAEACICVRDEF